MASADLKEPTMTVTESPSTGWSSGSWWKSPSYDSAFVTVDGDSSVSSSIKDGVDFNENAFGSVFQDANAAKLYEPPPEYEGYHRYDPNFTWNDIEEKALIRKLDWRVCLWVCIMFFALQLDRGNISQALSDNFLVDLHMTTNDFNNGQTIFYCAFLFAEMPSQLVSKRLGPDNWIPFQMVAWSAVAASQAALTGRASFFICRALLGLIEGGFIPDVILYLSYFYKNKELPIRLAWFWTADIGTGIIAAFLAFGILHLDGKHGLEGWRWLFAIEGIITGLIGVISWFYLPPSPTQTKGHGFRGALRPQEGWFSEREEKIMVNRILRDDPGKSTMHNRQAITLKLWWDSITDYHMWPIYLIGLTWGMPMAPPVAYLTLTLKAIGFTTFQTNLLVIPSSVLFIFQLFFWTWLSEKVNSRILLSLASQLWVLPLLIAFETLPASFPHDHWVRYALSTLIVAYPYVHAILGKVNPELFYSILLTSLVALTSRNAGSVRTRTIGSSLYNMSVQMTTVISSQIYRADDAPLYFRANKALIGVVAYNIVLFIGANYYYVYVNKCVLSILRMQKT
jgi:hypothetical protein